MRPLPEPALPRSNAPFRATPFTCTAVPLTPTPVTVLFWTVGTGICVPEPTGTPVAETRIPEPPARATTESDTSTVDPPWF